MMNHNLINLFDKAAGSPEFIPKLRQLILDLAVRGKLVPQDLKDEPASELLKKIKAEKDKLIKKGEIRKGNDLPVISTDKIPFNVPGNWRFVNLGEVGYWANGCGFPQNEQGHNNLPYFFLKVSDMNLPGNEKHIKYSNNTIDDSIASRLKIKIHPPGTIMFPKIGGAIATNKRRILTKPSAFDNNCLGIKAYSHFELEYVFLFLTKLDLSKYQSGTAVPALQLSTLELIPFPLPPLAEQKRIVAKVDELMALCDELEVVHGDRDEKRQRSNLASLKAVTDAKTPEDFKKASGFFINHLPEITVTQEHIKNLRQLILDLAVRGKLVPQNPKDEPASELLKKIKAEKEKLVKEGKIRSGKPLSPISSEECPFEIPKNWQWVRLQSILIKLTDGTHHSPPNFDKGDYKYVTAKNIKSEGVELKNITYVSKEIHKEIYSRCNPEKGDILYIKDGATTGIVTINNLDEPFSMLSSVALLKISNSIYNQFLVFFLRSPFFYNQMRALMKGAAITRVTLKTISPTSLPLPPLTEQKRIVAKVNELMSLCDELEKQISISSTQSTRLLNAMLQDNY